MKGNRAIRLQKTGRQRNKRLRFSMTIKRSILLTLFLWLSQVLCAAGSPSLGRDQAEEPVRMWHYARFENTRGVGIIILPGGSYHHLGIRNEGHDGGQAFTRRIRCLRSQVQYRYVRECLPGHDGRYSAGVHAGQGKRESTPTVG